jgi:DNA-binding MarR family transcriptional regulator
VRTFDEEQPPDAADGEVRQVGELWRAINRVAHAGIRQAFRGSDLGPPAMFVLGQLSREPGLTINEIARRTGIAKSHISNTVNALARDAYVEKKPDEEDARLVRVYLAPAAQGLIADLEERSHEAWRGAVQKLSDKDRAAVLKSLRLLLDALESERREEVAPEC